MTTDTSQIDDEQATKTEPTLSKYAEAVASHIQPRPTKLALSKIINDANGRDIIIGPWTFDYRTGEWYWFANATDPQFLQFVEDWVVAQKWYVRINAMRHYGPNTSTNHIEVHLYKGANHIEIKADGTEGSHRKAKATALLQAFCKAFDLEVSP